MRIVFVTLCILAMSVVKLRAEVTVRDFKDRLASDETKAIMLAYVDGLGLGMGWANDMAKSKGAPLYCQPEKLALRADNYIDIIEREIVAGGKRMAAAKLDGIPIVIILMKGLQETFPCKEK